MLPARIRTHTVTHHASCFSFLLLLLLSIFIPRRFWVCIMKLMTYHLTHVRVFFCRAPVLSGCLRAAVCASAHANRSFACVSGCLCLCTFVCTHRASFCVNESLSSEPRGGLRIPGSISLCPLRHKALCYKLLTLPTYILQFPAMCLTLLPPSLALSPSATSAHKHLKGDLNPRFPPRA